MPKSPVVGMIWVFKMKQIMGSTLVEVLVTFVLLVIGVTLMIIFHASALRTQHMAQQQSDASMLAEQKINALRDYGPVTSYDNIISGNQTVTLNNTSYNVVWVVTTNTAPDYKTIQVTVSWTDSENRGQSVVQESIVAKIDVTKSGQYMEGLPT